ncbi:DNA-J related domain-containing protein [uncultured Pseudoalteromonas sp.]|uniref:DNA-J related domain-containing protein n=1 Tax=uncultured Pseudoalteromonas sp. TaxID=114053 RepID=UPI0030C7FDA5
MLNPLIDEIFELLLTKRVWKVHTLAATLAEQGGLPSLDANPEQNLFKKNFLIMNALFELQTQLLPKHLIISSLHIELAEPSSNVATPSHLKNYYLNWQNYDTSAKEIEDLLDSFWQQFNSLTQQPAENIEPLLKAWQLPANFSMAMLQKRWRQQALKHHPDKQTGSACKFKQIRAQYEQLKRAAHKV